MWTLIIGLSELDWAILDLVKSVLCISELFCLYAVMCQTYPRIHLNVCYMFMVIS